MRHQTLAWGTSLMAALLLGGGAVGAAGPHPHQSGPLDIGADHDGAPLTQYCSQQVDTDMAVGFAAIIQNRTERPAELQSVEFVDPVNLRPGAGKAWA